MKTVVRYLCFLIVARLCEANEGIDTPENCSIESKYLCIVPCDFYRALSCPDFTMVLLSYYSSGHQEVVGRVICSSGDLPYKYLPNLNSTRNALYVQDCQLPEHGSFGDGWPKLEFLTVSNYETTIGPLKREHFSGLNNVWNLELRMPHSRHVMPDYLFADLTELRKLDLTYREVNTNIFKNLSKLEILNINIRSRESVDNFDTSELKDLTALKTLNLISFDFGRLTKRFLEGFRNIETLDIRHCRFETIEADAFEPLTNLKNFILIRNNLISLPEGLFKQNLKLQRVLIEKNGDLTSLPSGLFSYLPDLREIKILSGLTSIPNDFIRGSFNLEHLDLQFNKLTSLPRDLLQNHSKLKKIELYGNKLNETSNNLFDSMSPATEVGSTYHDTDYN